MCRVKSILSQKNFQNEAHYSVSPKESLNIKESTLAIASHRMFLKTNQKSFIATEKANS